MPQLIKLKDQNKLKIIHFYSMYMQNKEWSSQIGILKFGLIDSNWSLPNLSRAQLSNVSELLNDMAYKPIRDSQANVTSDKNTSRQAIGILGFLFTDPHMVSVMSSVCNKRQPPETVFSNCTIAPLLPIRSTASIEKETHTPVCQALENG